MQVPKLISKVIADASAEEFGDPLLHSPNPDGPLSPRLTPKTKAEAQARQRGSLVGSGLRGSRRGRKNAAAAGMRLPPSDVVTRGPTPTSAASTRADGGGGVRC